MNRGPFHTLDQLVGTAERNWVHMVSRKTLRTLCGFGPSDYATLVLKHGFAPEKECPDCARLLAARGKGGPGVLSAPTMPSAAPVTVDATIERSGGLALIRPGRPEVEAWLRENLEASTTWANGAAVVEIPYLMPIVLGMLDAGFAHIKMD